AVLPDRADEPEQHPVDPVRPGGTPCLSRDQSSEIPPLRRRLLHIAGTGERLRRRVHAGNAAAVRRLAPVARRTGPTGATDPRSRVHGRAAAGAGAARLSVVSRRSAGGWIT